MFLFFSCWDLLHTSLALQLLPLCILRLLEHSCTFVIRLESGRERGQLTVIEVEGQRSESVEAQVKMSVLLILARLILRF